MNRHSPLTPSITCHERPHTRPGSRHGWSQSRHETGGQSCYRLDEARAAELGRTIDEDHYGAGFAFRFGSPEVAALNH